MHVSFLSENDRYAAGSPHLLFSKVLRVSTQSPSRLASYSLLDAVNFHKPAV